MKTNFPLKVFKNILILRSFQSDEFEILSLSFLLPNNTNSYLFVLDFYFRTIFSVYGIDTK